MHDVVAGCPRVEGDEEEGAEMDDLEEEFPVKSPKKPHEPVAFDVFSENGEQPAQKWRTGGHTLSSFTGSGECSSGCVDDVGMHVARSIC